MNDSSTTTEKQEKPDDAERIAFETWDKRRGPREYVRGEWEKEWSRIQREGK